MTDFVFPAENYPYPEDKGRTHWLGCYRAKGHHNCAVARCDDALIEIHKLKVRIEQVDRILASWTPGSGRQHTTDVINGARKLLNK